MVAQCRQLSYSAYLSITGERHAGSLEVDEWEKWRGQTQNICSQSIHTGEEVFQLLQHDLRTSAHDASNKMREEFEMKTQGICVEINVSYSWTFTVSLTWGRSWERSMAHMKVVVDSYYHHKLMIIIFQTIFPNCVSYEALEILFFCWQHNQWGYWSLRNKFRRNYSTWQMWTSLTSPICDEPLFEVFL